MSLRPVTVYSWYNEKVPTLVELLDVHERILWWLLREGDLRERKVGRSWLVAREAQWTSAGRRRRQTMTWEIERVRRWREAKGASYREDTAGEPAAVASALCVVERWLRGMEMPGDVDLYVRGIAEMWDELPQGARDYLEFCTTDTYVRHTVADLLALRGQSDDHDWP